MLPGIAAQAQRQRTLMTIRFCWNALFVGVATTPEPCAPVAIGSGAVSSK